MKIEKILSYAYRPENGVFLVRLVDIEEPKRSGGREYFRSEEHYKSMKNSICNRVSLPPIEVFSKEKTNSLLFRVHDGYHRYHISKELNFDFIPVKINDWDMNEFLEQERLNSITSGTQL